MQFGLLVSCSSVSWNIGTYLITPVAVVSWIHTLVACSRTLPVTVCVNVACVLHGDICQFSQMVYQAFTVQHRCVSCSS